MAEISEIRKRLRHAIAEAKRTAADRRTQVDFAIREYEGFLEKVAVPVYKMFGAALKAEGYSFTLSTPRGKVRLVAERSGDDYLELELDTAHRPPVVLGRANHTRGRQITAVERPIKEGEPISSLTEEDVLQFLLEEIRAFIES